jgi:site-specific recombinase XerD
MKPSEIRENFKIVASRKLAVSTEQCYWVWIGKFLGFLKSPEACRYEESERKVEVFLSNMAREDYSKISQNQAFNAILFLYRHVLKKDLQDVSALRCRRGSRERYTPTQPEILAMLHELHNTPTYNLRLIVSLLYACGLRVSEACQLRIKDFDIARQSLTVFEGKGDKDRQVRLPEILLPAIRKQLARSTALAEIDIADHQPVQLPGRLDVKYPKWQFESRWHFVFPSPKPCSHPRTGKIVRWCIGADVIQRAVKAAAIKAGVAGKVTPHCLRHSFATHLLDGGQNIARVAEAMGHTDIRTTAGYARKECMEMVSPIENIIPIRRTA